MLTVCLTFDFDALSPWVYDMGPGNVAAISRGEFGAVAVPRILAMLERHAIPATFFIPGHTALAYPDLVRRIRDAGHEIGHHGWVHEPLTELSEEREREVLVRGLEALDQVAGVRPVGYRAPSVEVTVHTVALLRDHGFSYDASFSMTDFEPVYLRTGDTWSKDEPYHFGEYVDLVGVPFNWSMSDFTYFELVPGGGSQQSPPSVVHEIWQGEFRWAAANAGDDWVFDLTMHPQAIGRGPRLAMVERLVAEMRSTQGVQFERMGDYAGRWRTQHPLAAWRSGGQIRPSSQRASSVMRSGVQGGS